MVGFAVFVQIMVLVSCGLMLAIALVSYLKSKVLGYIVMTVGLGFLVLTAIFGLIYYAASASLGLLWVMLIFNLLGFVGLAAGFGMLNISIVRQLTGRAAQQPAAPVQGTPAPPQEPPANA